MVYNKRYVLLLRGVYVNCSNIVETFNVFDVEHRDYVFKLKRGGDFRNSLLAAQGFVDVVDIYLLACNHTVSIVSGYGNNVVRRASVGDYVRVSNARGDNLVSKRGVREVNKNVVKHLSDIVIGVYFYRN